MSVVDSAFEAASDATDKVRTYLATERGRRMRHRLGTALIITAPLMSELPGFRRTMLARLLRTAGVVALVVKGAEWLRDWEPQQVPEV
jgi:hypothetical protein